MVNLIQIAPKDAPTFAMSRQKAAELLGISSTASRFSSSLAISRIWTPVG